VRLPVTSSLEGQGWREPHKKSAGNPPETEGTFDMRAILIPLVPVVLALALQTAVSAYARINQNTILADDADKDETEKKDKTQGSGDEEPDCE
jgi:hypothetical protein